MDILSCLDNPGIVRLFEVFQEPESLIFVMEYLSGHELYNVLLNKKRMSEKQAA
jgi:serine/threonine protein kinase